jgi:hypothetical protein
MRCMISISYAIYVEVDLAARLCETGEWIFSRDSTLVSQACSRKKLEKEYLLVRMYKEVCMYVG